MLREIDDQLRADSIEIAARPIHAVMKMSNRLRISLPLVTRTEPQSDDALSPEAITSSIHAWYRAQYGSRLELEPAPSWFACFLGGDPWRVRIPRLLAGVVAAAIRNPEVRSVPSGIHPSDGQPKLLNVFDLVEELSLPVRLDCSDKEQADLQFFFGVAVDLSNSIRRTQKLSMVAPALGDFVASVDKIFQQPKDLGGSRWASLQFVEKLLKAFISVCGKQPGKKGHDLARYAREAEDCGLPQHPQTSYDAIQCDAGVRYGDSLVSMAEAMKAHQEAMRLGAAISQAIKVVAAGKGLIPTR